MIQQQPGDPVGGQDRHRFWRRRAQERDPAERKLRGSLWRYALAVLGYLFAAVLFVVCHWSRQAFNISVNEIVNTMLSPLTGTSSDAVESAFQACAPPIVLAVLLCAAFLLYDRRRTRRVRALPRGEVRARRARQVLLLRRTAVLLTAFSLCASLAYANACYDVLGYVTAKLKTTTLFEDCYVDPNSVEISAAGETKDLIYIYVESLETTYTSREQGGAQVENLIPSLTRLAEENVSFSNRDGRPGGFYSNYGANWTQAAMFATTTGLPHDFPAGDYRMRKAGTYASGVTALGDILRERGYRNEFLCGSDARFANCALYFQQHGGYEIFDYHTMVERGYIPEDYYVWWGCEDRYVYEAARDELTRLYASGEPFNLTLATLDTHFPEGYVCALCPDGYEETAANVVACADRQLGEFIEWCRAQPFFEDTVIVISGDHPRMDKALVRGTAWEDRMVYDCFLNAAKEPVRETGRVATTMDIFPTVLSALGFQIEGDRLGLGTDLFSARPTLAEERGLDWLQEQLQRRSDFYLPNFAPELLDERSRAERK